jgi:hypothetical protein
MRYLCVLILCVLAGCSGVGVVEFDDAGIGEQSQAASASFSVYNASTPTWSSSSTFCVPAYFGASGGHTGSPTWSSGVAKYGYGADYLGFLAAFPYDLTIGGHAYAWSRCYDYSDFGITGGQTSDSSPPYVQWTVASGSGLLGMSTELWSEQAFCYLGGVYSLSHTNEEAKVEPPASGTGNWTLAISGYAYIRAEGKCVHPNKAWTLLGPYTVANGVVWGPSTTSSVCALSRVKGNYDDQSAWITQESGQWKLTATGVTAAMRCAFMP